MEAAIVFGIVALAWLLVLVDQHALRSAEAARHRIDRWDGTDQAHLEPDEQRLVNGYYLLQCRHVGGRVYHTDGRGFYCPGCNRTIIVS
jgi:hypothetical protein